MSIVVVVGSAGEAHRLVHWAALLGRARDQDVVVLSTAVRPGASEETEVPLDGEPPDDEVGEVVAAIGRARRLSMSRSTSARTPSTSRGGSSSRRSPGWTGTGPGWFPRS